MYDITETEYGYRLTFGDFIRRQEMERWLEDSKRVLQDAPASFCLFVDMRTLRPLPKDAQEIILAGQTLYRQRGMTRSVVILSSVLTSLQFHRIARESGIFNEEWYIDASVTPNWEDVGLQWLLKHKEPERNLFTASRADKK